MPPHLFVSDIDGALYDTRIPGWSSLPPLREVFRRHYQQIRTVAELKATLRAGRYAWPGGYPLYFLADDGEALSFNTVRENLRWIIPSVAGKIDDGWRVVFLDVNYEDNNLFDAHTNERIESAYGNDDGTKTETG